MPATVSLSQIRASLPLLNQVTAKLDVDKTKSVGAEELKRLVVRDSFVSRNVIDAAMNSLSYPDNAGPYSLSGLEGAFETGLRSLERADKDKDGVLSTAELAKASRVGKGLAAFAMKHDGRTAADFPVRAFEKPGTPAWLKLAQKEYFGGPSEPMNRPYFGTALVLRQAELPNEKLKAAYAALKAEFPGATVQATSSKVNGATVYYMHAMTDARYDARIFDSQGALLSTGVATPDPKNARADWNVAWR